MCGWGVFSPVGGGGLIPKVREASSTKMNEFPEEKNLILELDIGSIVIDRRSVGKRYSD